MAEETKEKKEKKDSIYKFGESELDLNTYIHTLGHNLNNYLDKVKKDWTEEQRQEFTTAYDRYLMGLKEQRDSGVERFTSTDYGRILDSQGKLSNTDDDGIDPVGSEYYYNDKGERITTDDYNLLSDKKKKKYKTFSANREVASYFKRIAEAIKADQSKKTTKAETPNMFDITKHGYIPYHASRYNPTGGTWDGQAILDLDSFDETTGKRGTSQRTARLASDLEQYLNEMDSTIDFSKTRWKTREGYENFIRGTISKINDGLTPQDYLYLEEAGLTREFLEPYVTTEKSLMTKEQRDAADAKAKTEADAKAREEQNKAYQEMMQQRLDIYDRNKGNYDEYNPFHIGGPTYYNIATGEFNQQGYDDAIQYRNAPSLYTGTGQPLTYDEILKNLFSYNQDIFNPRNKELNRALLSYMLELGNVMYPISDGIYKGWYYLPWEEDRKLNRATIYNPITGYIQRVFIGDIPEERAKIDNKWKRDNGLIRRIDDFKLYRDGGSINHMQLGGGISMDDLDKEYRKQSLKERAKQSGRTEEQQKAGERKTNSEALSLNNPDAGFSGTDMVRLAAIGADVGSMIAAFIPGYGTAVSGVLGAGSTFATFGADVAEDGLDWGDIGGLATGLSLDVLGMIPHFGAGSKAAKIAKNVGKWVPRIVAALGTMATVTNAPQIISSFNKLTTDFKNMTVDDWRNVAQGIGLVTGVTGAVARKTRQEFKKDKLKAKDMIAVEFQDKNGVKKTVAFQGDDAKAIRQAAQDNDVEGIRRVTTQKYEDLKDFDVSHGSRPGWKGLKDETGSYRFPGGMVETNPRVFNIYNNRGRVWVDKPYDLSGAPSKTVDSATELTSATVDAALKNERTKALDQLRNISRRRKIGADNAKKKIKDTDDAFTAEIKAKKDALDAANATGNPSAIISAKNEHQDALARQLDWQTRRAKLQSYIDDFNSGKVYDNWKSKYLQGTGDDAKLVISDPRYTRKEELIFKDILQSLGVTPSNFKYEKGGRIQALARFLDSQIIKAGNGTKLQTTGTDVVSDEKKRKNTPASEKQKFSWELDPNLKFGLPRALYADQMNRRMTDLMKESPVLQNPIEHHRTVQSDLNAEIQGHRSAAMLANMASKPVTSDASLQLATQLEAANKGQEFINKGMEASNNAYRQSAELAWQQEKENAKNKNAIASINRTAQMTTEANNRKHEAAYLSKKATIWDTFAKQLEYDVKTDNIEKKAEQKALVRSDIKKQILDELQSESGAAKYGLLPSHVAVLKELNSGKSISDLSEEQQKLMTEVNKIIEELVTSRYAEWRGLIRYYTGTPKINTEENNDEEVVIVKKEKKGDDEEGAAVKKKGGKIEVAGIKARTDDAERFQKLIIESIKRNEKTLDRLSKSMVNYVKDIMK